MSRKTPELEALLRRDFHLPLPNLHIFASRHTAHVLSNSRSVHDVKTTSLGVEKSRFKAEIDFNGKEITRAVSPAISAA